MATQKLCQVLAVEKAAKATAEKEATALYHTLQKADLFDGMTRTYESIRDDGDKLPPETKIVQQTVDGVLAELRRACAEAWDVAATKDEANMHARADVVVDGVVLLTQQPATHLLYLEKKLLDLHTVIAKLPTLDPAEAWTLDQNTRLFKTAPKLTQRTKKEPRVIVGAPATDKHPAQVQIVMEDQVVGHYHLVRASGAIPEARKRALLERVDKLAKAVKFAREEANTVAAPPQHVGAALLGYVFG